MLGFVFKLALDPGMTHGQRTILLKLELLNQKLESLKQNADGIFLATGKTF